MNDTPMRSGAEVFADAVHHLGFHHVLHIAGEGILEMIEALATRHPDIRQTTFRHEGGMVYATLTMGLLSGTPALCLVARAPGALNTALALHTADTDAAPMVMVIGQTALDQADRDRMSGFEFASVFGPLAKEVLHVTDACRIPEMLARAWHVAASGRMGPVVVVLPENTMHQRVAVADRAAPVLAHGAPAVDQIEQLRGMVRRARRPLLLAGGTGWSGVAVQALAHYAQRHDWPIATTYRRSPLFDNTDPHYAGELGIGIDPALCACLENADLIIAINVRLGELNTFGPGGFGGFQVLQPAASRHLVHVHPAPAELQKLLQADLAIACGPQEFLRVLPAPEAPPEAGWTSRLRAARIAFTRSGDCPGPVNLRDVFIALRRALSGDAIVTVGAGAYAVWLHRYFEFVQPHTLAGPKSGAMGYGLSAAIGAALLHPDRTVVAVAGDGCFLMHAEEMATAVQNRLDILVLLINNQGYGAIRASQQRLFGRATGTDLTNPDFPAFARSFGAQAQRVTSTAEFEPALQWAMQQEGVRLIEVQVPPTVSKPR